MILVLDNEVQPDYRYLGSEIERHLPEASYRVFVDDPTLPELEDWDGIVLSGSTASIYDESHADWVDPQCDLVRRCIEEDVPLLGICFGHQLVNYALGGSVEQDRRRATFVEMSRVSDSEVDESNSVLESVESIVPVLHADLVTDPGDEMMTTARTDYNAHFCTRHRSAPLWTVQFHPEFTEQVKDEPSDWTDGDYSFEDTNATRVLTNFAALCGAESDV